MHGLMMDFPLTIPVILRRAAQFGGRREIVSRWPDRSITRATYPEFARRAEHLAAALIALGLRPGDRVATLCWNHQPHLEAYFGVPLAGGVVHTLNLRLHPDDLAYIASHAEDRFVIVDAVLWPLFEKFRDRVRFERVIVVGGPTPEGALDYESLVASGDPTAVTFPEIGERDAAAMCYTSGTTGRPKGVLYSHRSIVLHAMGMMWAEGLGLGRTDTLLPVVPMFHVNAWGLPYAAAMVGANLVFPGPHLDPASIVELFVSERVTITAGVPTIWMGMLQYLDAHRGEFDLSAIRAMAVGGAAVPRAMIEAYDQRHGLRIVQAWGMTETSPLGSVAVVTPERANGSAGEQYATRATQGRPVPFVEIRVRGDEGLVPWDGRSMGELEVRGPWIASAYVKQEDGSRFTDDGWFRTGDIVTVAPDGYITIQDRSKDVIKSGGEWISSVALENAIMSHPSVAEAAVVAVQDERWGERPLAAVVLRAGQHVTAEVLRAHLADQVAKWWIPERIEFVEEIPKTSVGKFLKSALRKRFGNG